MRAMQLLEQYVGHEEVVRLIEQDGGGITFRSYPRYAGWLTGMRERINEAIAAQERK
jgi:hypothetical protein